MARRRQFGGFNDKVLISIAGIVAALTLVEYADELTYIMIFGVFITVFYLWFRSYSAKKEREKILNSGINQIDLMNGTDFEQFLGVLFKRMGYKVAFTPTSGDYGADLILRKEGRAIAVQAKRYKSSVGVAAVQEVSGARGYYGAPEAWVVTNNTYTKNARILADRTNVKLIDRGQLINLITQVNTATPANSVDAAETH
ncbi:restriction endonuclease [Bacillus sp. 37MA]|uniref:restriction endonuclease n=1 Tax=Bacillus sp. 37MA TaxID=1132442 RepID=UPI00083C3CC8|nr:restriction endonuclease [Bacillus sp. 37MA]